jgi:hypothetical protein
VPGLPCEAVGAPLEDTAGDVPRPDTGSEGHEQGVIDLRRTVEVLGPCGARRVVLDGHGQPHTRPELVADGDLLDAGQVGRDAQGAGAVDQPGDAESDGRQRCARRLQVEPERLDQRHQRVEELAGAGGRRDTPFAQGGRRTFAHRVGSAVNRVRDAEDLGTTDVEADYGSAGS